jgi:cytochrome P450
LICYARYRKFYKPQGIPFVYYPILGWPYLLAKGLLKSDQLTYWKRLFENKEEGITITNGNESGNPWVWIHSPKLFSELMRKETDVCIRFNSFKAKMGNSMVFKSGDKIMKLRGAMADIFNEKNMKKITPRLVLIVKKIIKKIKIENFSDSKKNEFKVINMNKYVEDLFLQLVSEILFGVSDDEELKEIIILTGLILNEGFKIQTHPMNLITKMHAGDFGLIKMSRDLDRWHKESKEKVRAVYRERMGKLGKRKLGINVIDLLIKHNLDEEKKKNFSMILSEDEVIENSLLFMFVGSDTSKILTKSLISALSQVKEAREVVQNEARNEMFKNDTEGQFSDTYVRNNIFDLLFKEGMRLFSPAFALLPRKAIKTFKLGKYKIYKNSMIFIPYSFYVMNEKYFEQADQFLIDRFEKSKTNKDLRHIYFPFGIGKRNCIGRYLAELVAKVNLSHFAKEFDFQKAETFNGKKYEPTFRMAITYHLKDCVVKLRPARDMIN